MKKYDNNLFFGDLFEERTVSDRVYFYSDFYKQTKDSFKRLYTDLHNAQQFKKGVEFWYAEDLSQIINNVSVVGYDSKFSDYLLNRALVPANHYKMEIIQASASDVLMADLFNGPIQTKTRLSRYGSFILTAAWIGDGPFKSYMYRDVNESNFAPADMMDVLKKETELFYALFFFMSPGRASWDVAKYVYENTQIRLYELFCSQASRLGAIINMFKEHRITDFGMVYEKIFNALFDKGFKDEFYDVFARNIELGTKTSTYYRYLRPEYLFIVTKLMNKICAEAESRFKNYFEHLNKHRAYFGSNGKKKADVSNVFGDKKYQNAPTPPNLRGFYDWIKKESLILKYTIKETQERYKEVLTDMPENLESKFLYQCGNNIKKAHKKMGAEFHQNYSNTNVLTLKEAFNYCKEQRRIVSSYPKNFPRELMTMLGIGNLKERTG